MTQYIWLTSHPYLEPAARFHAQIDSAAGISVREPSPPNWDKYIADFDKGIPLLLSTAAEIDFEP